MGGRKGWRPGLMAMHENNKKKVKKKKQKVHHRGADCTFRSLTTGQNNYSDIKTHTHSCMHTETDTLGTGLF